MRQFHIAAARDPYLDHGFASSSTKPDLAMLFNFLMIYEDGDPGPFEHRTAKALEPLDPRLDAITAPAEYFVTERAERPGVRASPHCEPVACLKAARLSRADATHAASSHSTF